MSSITRTNDTAVVRIVETIEFDEGEHVVDTDSGRERGRINIDTMKVELRAEADGGVWPEQWEDEAAYVVAHSARGRYVKKDGTVGKQVAAYIPRIDAEVHARLLADMIARWGTPAEAFAKVGA